MSSDQQDEPGPGPLSGLGRFTSGFGWNQATNFVKALATDVGMYCSRLNQMSIIDPTLSEIFVDTLSNENSELIDDVKTTSLNVAANIRQTGFQEQAKSTVSKGLEAGAGLEQHILLLQNDISTYIDVREYSSDRILVVNDGIRIPFLQSVIQMWKNDSGVFVNRFSLMNR
uniref:Uncharacterized protein n=1 Tax=Spongospora subterranea TaxID=70186 RepID=A0A0H5QRQ9_9EUKA|eukprot:CRZ04297.1 hypothetical protein [Spongospora subterranea]